MVITLTIFFLLVISSTFPCRNALILQGEIFFCFFVRVKGLTPNSQSLSFKKFMAGGAEN